MDANLKEMKRDIKTSQAKEGTNLREMKEEKKAEMDIHQEKMEVAIHFIWSELEETIKHRVDDILSCGDQKMQGLQKELTQKIGETQL
jgi:predicted nuclease with TOPRIM domain